MILVLTMARNVEWENLTAATVLTAMKRQRASLTQFLTMIHQLVLQWNVDQATRIVAMVTSASWGINTYATQFHTSMILVLTMVKNAGWEN